MQVWGRVCMHVQLKGVFMQTFMPYLLISQILEWHSIFVLVTVLNHLEGPLYTWFVITVCSAVHVYV